MQLDLSAPEVVTFKYQLDPCIDGIGTQPLLPLLSRFLFHGGREVDARNPDAGLGDGVSPMHRLGSRYKPGHVSARRGALPMKIDVGPVKYDCKFQAQGASAHRSGDS